MNMALQEQAWQPGLVFMDETQQSGMKTIGLG